MRSLTTEECLQLSSNLILLVVAERRQRYTSSLSSATYSLRKSIQLRPLRSKRTRICS